MKKIEMVGKKFGMLEVIEESGKDDKRHLMYKCKCDCGNIKNIHGTHLRSNKTISCGCKNKVKGINGELWYNIVKGSLKSRTKRKNLFVNITKEYLNDLFIKQQGKCNLSGIEISLPKKWNDKNYTASLDRIDSEKGYEIGNVQWVHKHINVMKNIFPQELFLYMCQKVANQNNIVKIEISKLNEFKFGLNEKYKAGK
jgi:hypothetical protein